jgi:hypothetical protein
MEAEEKAKAAELEARQLREQLQAYNNNNK